MNRFVMGGILAAIVVLLMGGINRLFADREPGSARLERTTALTREEGDLGSLPVEQAGQLVRRQSDRANGGAAASSDTVFNNQDPGMTPGERAIIAPGSTAGTAGANNNIIPRTGQTSTSPPYRGDIAPIDPDLVQPNLVQPGTGQETDDSASDSIPALW